MAKKKSSAVAKAEKAEKAVKKGVMKKVVKKRFSVTFHRPETLKKSRAPLYPRKRCARAHARGRPTGRCERERVRATGRDSARVECDARETGAAAARGMPRACPRTRGMERRGSDHHGRLGGAMTAPRTTACV